MNTTDKGPNGRGPSNVWMCSGIVGALVAFLCCLTQLAVLGLSVAGLGYLTGNIDYIALPLFAVSMGLIGYGLIRRTCCGKSCNLMKSP